MDIQQGTIVITGASDGIGKEIALALAKRHASLALLGRNMDRLHAVEESVKAMGGNVKKYVCDVQSSKQIADVVKQIEADFQGKIIGLVNNAGIWQKKATLENISDEEIKNVLEIDLGGVIAMTKALLPTLKKQPEAAIVNISSRSGITAQPNQSVYTAAKWGVKGFTEVLKEDLKESSVHVAGVYQGGTNTQMFNKVGEGFSEEKLKSFIPAASLGEVIAYILELPQQIWLSEVHVENR